MWTLFSQPWRVAAARVGRHDPSSRASLRLRAAWVSEPAIATRSDLVQSEPWIPQFDGRVHQLLPLSATADLAGVNSGWA